MPTTRYRTYSSNHDKYKTDSDQIMKVPKKVTLKPGANPGFFFRRGALVSCSTSTPINGIVFFLQNTAGHLGGGGAHPLHPPPRSAPGSSL